jgi:hypothetical protein
VGVWLEVRGTGIVMRTTVTDGPLSFSYGVLSSETHTPVIPPSWDALTLACHMPNTGPLLANLSAQSSSTTATEPGGGTPLPSLLSQQQQQQGNGGVGGGPSQLSRLATQQRVGGMAGGGVGGTHGSGPLAGGGPGASGQGQGQGAQVPAERRAANAVALRALFESLVAELTAAVESLAVTEFNAWLVSPTETAVAASTQGCMHEVHVTQGRCTQDELCP